MTSRTIPAKAHKVTDPDGNVYFVYAQTKQGAIAATRESLKRKDEWRAELATGEDLYLAARNETAIINAPESIREPDALVDFEI